MNTLVEYRRGASAYGGLRDRQTVDAPGSQAALYGHEVLTSDWSKLFEDLEKIRSLKNDWDGEGAAAPGPEVTDGAKSFAMMRMRCGQTPPDCVTPGFNGTIFFEWHSLHGYCEVEVYSPCFAEQRFVPAGTEEVIVSRFPTGECGPGYEF